MTVRLALRDDGGMGSPSRVRARNMLIGVQMAGTVMLLLVAGLLLRALDTTTEDFSLDSFRIEYAWRF